MTGIFEQMHEQIVSEYIEEELVGEYTDTQKDGVRKAITDWFATTRKRPTTDRLAQFAKDVDALVDNLVIKLEDGELTVSATGRGERVLLFLQRGTNWYVGNPNIKSEIIEAVFKQR